MNVRRVMFGRIIAQIFLPRYSTIYPVLHVILHRYLDIGWFVGLAAQPCPERSCHPMDGLCRWRIQHHPESIVQAFWIQWWGSMAATCGLGCFVDLWMWTRHICQGRTANSWGTLGWQCHCQCNGLWIAHGTFHSEIGGNGQWVLHSCSFSQNVPCYHMHYHRGELGVHCCQ
jgi:hypothetical protein